MNWAQWTSGVLVALGLLVSVHENYTGSEAKHPAGFQGLARLLVARAVRIWIYYEAGLWTSRQ